MHAIPLIVAIHVFSAGEAGFHANAYLVETEKAVVAIDAPFTVSEAKAFKKRLDAIGKPLAGVLVTHAHPDHVNGIAILTGDAKMPIVALASVDETLRAIDGPKREYWKPIYKDEYPDSTRFPTKTVKDGETVSLGGVTFRAHDLGAGEAEAQTIWIVEGKDGAVAFVGDLVMNETHPWLAEGRSKAWLASLDTAKTLLAAKKVKTVHPGHGPAGGVELLAAQARYLEAYRAAVRELAKGRATLTEPQKKKLAERMEKVLPKGKLAILVGMSADAVAAELAAEK